MSATFPYDSYFLIRTILVAKKFGSSGGAGAPPGPPPSPPPSAPVHDEGPPASLSLGALGHVLGQGRTISKYKSHQMIEEFMKFKTQQILLFTLWN